MYSGDEAARTRCDDVGARYFTMHSRIKINK